MSNLEKIDITDTIIDSRDVEDELTAEEMFEKLGYITDINDERIIYYNRDVNIIFDLETKTVEIDASISIVIRLLEAINKKAEELRWI